jgi:hypothetical protein
VSSGPPAQHVVRFAGGPAPRPVVRRLRPRLFDLATASIAAAIGPTSGTQRCPRRALRACRASPCTTRPSPTRRFHQALFGYRNNRCISPDRSSLESSRGTTHPREAPGKHLVTRRVSAHAGFSPAHNSDMAVLASSTSEPTCAPPSSIFFVAALKQRSGALMPLQGLPSLRQRCFDSTNVDRRALARQLSPTDPSGPGIRELQGIAVRTLLVIDENRSVS